MMNFPRDQHDCYGATDPRINDELHCALKGKVAVVFGAGRGVGRSCAEFLSRSSARAIICLALEEQEVIETAEICKKANDNVETRAFGIDVKDSNAVEKIICDIEREFSRIDVLVMNAGRPGQWLTTVESDPGVWWDTVAVSLQGAFNCSHAVLPIMQRQKSGRIIFTSSIGAHSNRLMGGYVVGKLGQVRLAEIIHAENFQAYNIKCFAYNPGVVKTRFFTDFEEKATGKPVQVGSYASRNDDLDLKSAMFAYNTLKSETFDAPEMAAGLVTALAAGKLDFMSGRYLDAAVNIQHYIDHRERIVKNDLCRVRLNLGEEGLTPSLDY